MAQYLVRNSLNPSKVVVFGVTFTQVVPKNADGEHIWLVAVGTDEKDVGGNKIPIHYINTTTLSNIDKEIAKITAEISNLIDWSPLQSDSFGPVVVERNPSTYYMDIDDDIRFTLKDFLPSTGIDVSTVKIFVNDFDVTDEVIVSGDPYEYNFSWGPRIRVKTTY